MQTKAHSCGQVPDPTDRPTLSVQEAGELLGLGRSKAYAEAERFLTTGGVEGLPVLRFGRTLRVPTARLRELLGMGQTASP